MPQHRRKVSPDDEARTRAFEEMLGNGLEKERDRVMRILKPYLAPNLFIPVHCVLTEEVERVKAKLVALERKGGFRGGRRPYSGARDAL